MHPTLTLLESSVQRDGRVRHHRGLPKQSQGRGLVARRRSMVEDDFGEPLRAGVDRVVVGELVGSRSMMTKDVFGVELGMFHLRFSLPF
jgi:hypothetical protein